MYISKITIQGFKGFSEQVEIPITIPNGNKGSGLVIFVGNNNTGKSTTFEALEFLRNGLPKGKDIGGYTNRNFDGEVFIEVEFEGEELNDIIETFSTPKHKDSILTCVFEEKKFILRRNLRDAKKLLVKNPETNRYENIGGIDAVIKKLFEVEIIWANTNPESFSKYGSATLIGKLLKEMFSSFEDEPIYQNFLATYHNTFNDTDAGLRSRTNSISLQIERVFQEQFDDQTKISFHHEEPDFSTFVKQIGFRVDDGVETSMENKGGGSQRALALALLQVYAQWSSQTEGGLVDKPFFICIDEPEICMHPQAQNKLLNSLRSITKSRQIFISTHSPTVVQRGVGSGGNLFIFRKNSQLISVEEISNLCDIFPWSPTWGEVMYFAYNVCTKDFHNELYGYLFKQQDDLSTSRYETKDFDNYLNDQGIDKDFTWQRDSSNQYPLTKQTYIRNYMHHRENPLNDEYTDNQLKESIEEMISLT